MAGKKLEGTPIRLGPKQEPQPTSAEHPPLPGAHSGGRPERVDGDTVHFDLDRKPGKPAKR